MYQRRNCTLALVFLIIVVCLQTIQVNFPLFGEVDDGSYCAGNKQNFSQKLKKNLTSVLDLFYIVLLSSSFTCREHELVNFWKAISKFCVCLSFFYNSKLLATSLFLCLFLHMPCKMNTFFCAEPLHSLIEWDY